MRRKQWTELEDLPWWPGRFRNYQTDFLRDFLGLLGVYQKTVPILGELLDESGQVVDLCSGGAGPWTRLIEQIPEVQLTLTDLYPNREAFREASQHPRISYCDEAVDARAVKPELEGVRTLFTSFHHLDPESARGVLADAVECGRPIAVFEVVQRRWLNILGMPLVGLSVLLLTPFLRPLCPWRFFWTYLVPVVPLSTFWDGLISQFRAYHPEEMLALTEGLEGDFQWESGRIRCLGPLNLTYLVGAPAGYGVSRTS